MSESEEVCGFCHCSLQKEATCTLGDVYKAPGDADVLIVETGYQHANISDTVLVGDDTDLLVLLCSQFHNTVHKLFFRPAPKQNQKALPVCWDIRKLQDKLGKNVCLNMPFVHAVTGCDTTSRLFGVGKSTDLKRLKNNKVFAEEAALFRSATAS